MRGGPASKEGFARRLEPLAEELVVFARRSVDRPGDAEDVLQAALAAAWTHRRRFVEGTSFRAWIYRFIAHESLNANRRASSRRARTAALTADVPDRSPWEALEAELAYQELLSDPEALFDRLDADLAAALRAILPGERLALLLRAVAGLSCGEIAAALDVPRGTVLARLFRARVKLRERLARSHLGRHRAQERRDGS